MQHPSVELLGQIVVDQPSGITGRVVGLFSPEAGHMDEFRVVIRVAGGETKEVLFSNIRMAAPDETFEFLRT